MLVVTTALSTLLIVSAGVASTSLAPFVVLWAVMNLIRTLYMGSHGAYIGINVPAQWKTRATAIGEFRCVVTRGVS